VIVDCRVASATIDAASSQIQSSLTRRGGFLAQFRALKHPSKFKLSLRDKERGT
jgi:hypothetical protein